MLLTIGRIFSYNEWQFSFNWSLYFHWRFYFPSEHNMTGTG